VVIVLKANGRVTLMNMDEIEVEEFANIRVELGENPLLQAWQTSRTFGSPSISALALRSQNSPFGSLLASINRW
jgi:hypothetical protein